LRKKPRSLVGFLANEALNALHFDKVFLAANAVHVKLGVTTPNMLEAETKRRMLMAGEEKILVADHSKLGLGGICRICDLEELDLLITDIYADRGMASEIERKIKVLYAGEGGAIA